MKKFNKNVLIFKIMQLIQKISEQYLMKFRQM